MYKKDSSSRKVAAAGTTKKAEANQNPYSDFGKSHQANPPESNYAGNKVSKTGSYKKEATK